jgi:iron complex outermembrane recepter protein
MPTGRLIARARHAAIVCLVLLVCVRPGLAAADLDATAQFDIGPQALNTALVQFTEQSGVQITSAAELLKGRHSPGVSGSLRASEALTRMLAGTNLSYDVVDSNTAVITSPARFPASSSSTETSSGGAPSTVEEIVVTAQKRQERLQDVPVPVTAVNAESLAASNQLRLQDYYSQVPGLNLTPSTQSGQILSIRGISTGSGNPTVGVTVDDVPLGSSTFLGGAAVVPDIDPADLARIEVLRGPQGTLYGASSIGGLVKFVTADPSTEGVSGRIQGVVSDVRHGDGAGYSLRGSVNVPLSATWAVRASGFQRKDPGFIDNPTLGIDGVDQADAAGGRLSALWRPRDGFSLKLAALYQKISGDGSSDVLPTLGDLQQAYIRNSGAYDRKVQAYSAVLTAAVGGTELTSVTGYNINEFSDSFDGTFAFGPSTQTAFGVPGTPQLNTNETGKFSQELRLSGRFGSKMDWLLGAFYTDEDSRYQQTRLATEPVTGAVAGRVSFLGFPTTYAEHAAFGNVTFYLTEKLDVQLGARQGWIDQTYSSLAIDRFGAATTVPEVSVNTDALTYLGTIRYRISPDVMAYVRLASGYRAGGPNVTTGVGAAPLAYDPDTSNDYEIGFKADFLDHALSLDASVYYIDWQDIQLALRDAVSLQSYTDNAGAARSRGIELSVELRPLNGLTIAAWGAYNDAELTEAFPLTSTVRGSAGERLPFGSEWSGNLSIQEELTLTDHVAAVLGGSATYVGERLGRFTAATRDVFPGYTRFDLTAALRFDTWTANVFANNVADKRGVLATGLAPGTRVYIQPRTIGIAVSADF